MNYLMSALLLLFVLLLIIAKIKIKNINKRVYKDIDEDCKKRKDDLDRIVKSIEQKEVERKALNNLISDLGRISEEIKKDNQALMEQAKEQRLIIEDAITNGKKIVDTIMETERTTAQENLEAHIALMRTEAENSLREAIRLKKEEADNEFQEYKTTLLEQSDELLKRKIELSTEVSEYEQRRNALVESFKREAEMREQQDYHRIILSQETIDDMVFINQTLSHMHNKNIVAKVIWEELISTPTKEMLDRVVGKEKKTGIYKITEIATQRCYVGQAADIRARLTQHVKGTLGIQSIADQRVHHAMAETGVQNWTFEILEICEKEDLNSKEKYYIMLYESNTFGFNKTMGNKG